MEFMQVFMRIQATFLQVHLDRYFLRGGQLNRHTGLRGKQVSTTTPMQVRMPYDVFLDKTLNNDFGQQLGATHHWYTLLVAFKAIANESKLP